MGERENKTSRPRTNQKNRRTFPSGLFDPNSANSESTESYRELHVRIIAKGVVP